jgi:hypothetical protein
LHHPILALYHAWDGRRKPPHLDKMAWSEDYHWKFSSYMIQNMAILRLPQRTF